PAGDPVRRMDGAVRAVSGPRRLSTRRPSSSLIKPVALAVRRSEASKPRSRPRIEGDADRGGEHSWPKRADDMNVGRGQSLTEALDFAQEHLGGTGIGTVLAAGAFDLAPRFLCVDLKGDEELVVSRHSRCAADEIEVGTHRQCVHGCRLPVPRLAEIAAVLIPVGGHGSLEPLDATDGRALTGEA